MNHFLKVILSLTPLLLFSLPKVEFYIEWEPDLRMRGTEAFKEPLGHHQRIGKIFREKGLEVESFDFESYRSALKPDHAIWKFLSLRKPDPLVEEDVSYYIFWGVGLLLKDFDFQKLPKEKLILFTWEPPTTDGRIHDPKFMDQFYKVFTWDDDLVDDKKFFKFYYPTMRPMIKNLCPFKERKFCTLISSRLMSKHPKQIYTERERAIEFFEENHLGELDLYGRFWGKRNYKCYKGTVEDKIATMKNYKFCICYENTKNIKGYITEKIFDAFTSGCLPVYWGASNIEEYIPAGCFIDKTKFETYEELYDFLTNITEEEFEGCLTRIRAFLDSDAAKRFTIENLYNAIEQNIP